jgi:hypothetical protein
MLIPKTSVKNIHAFNLELANMLATPMAGTQSNKQLKAGTSIYI